jgi:hypothetical protein
MKIQELKPPPPNLVNENVWRALEYKAKVEEDRSSNASTPTHDDAESARQICVSADAATQDGKDWNASAVKIQAIARGKSERQKQKDLKAKMSEPLVSVTDNVRKETGDKQPSACTEEPPSPAPLSELVSEAHKLLQQLPSSEAAALLSSIRDNDTVFKGLLPRELLHEFAAGTRGQKLASEMTSDEAATLIQTRARGMIDRKKVKDKRRRHRGGKKPAGVAAATAATASAGTGKERAFFKQISPKQSAASLEIPTGSGSGILNGGGQVCCALVGEVNMSNSLGGNLYTEPLRVAPVQDLSVSSRSVCSKQETEEKVQLMKSKQMKSTALAAVANNPADAASMNSARSGLSENELSLSLSLSLPAASAVLPAQEAVLAPVSHAVSGEDVGGSRRRKMASEMTSDEAATLIQTRARGMIDRKKVKDKRRRHRGGKKNAGQPAAPRGAAATAATAATAAAGTGKERAFFKQVLAPKQAAGSLEIPICRLGSGSGSGGFSGGGGGGVRGEINVLESLGGNRFAEPL